MEMRFSCAFVVLQITQVQSENMCTGIVFKAVKSNSEMKRKYMTHKAVKCLVKQFYLLTGVSNLQCPANSDKGYWFEMFG